MIAPRQDHGITAEPDELARIFKVSILSVLLFGLAVALDRPVTTLGWILSGAGFLCLLYIVVASRFAMNQLKQKTTTPEGR